MLQIPNSVQAIVEQLPLEIQCVVVKYIIFNYLTENTDNTVLCDESEDDYDIEVRKCLDMRERLLMEDHFVSSMNGVSVMNCWIQF
ncbi:unnamed protein product [Ambrosiozyma monospora]|uniref:Unnamed protein product n=1 Tax=Ambrosiozyma monospora TaxID=43982 RepID=A0ACB5TGL5_AMBMO|nr:unnamed protein product [Ambrosiozyma monospora]